MIRLLMLTVASMLAFAGGAQAEEIRIGSGAITEGQSGSITTTPGHYCGAKAIRIVEHRSKRSVSLGRMYFSYAPNHPWEYSTYTSGATDARGLIKVPQMGCLQRVRINYQGGYPPPDDSRPPNTTFYTFYLVR